MAPAVFIAPLAIMATLANFESDSDAFRIFPLRCPKYELRQIGLLPVARFCNTPAPPRSAHFGWPWDFGPLDLPGD